jgi:hypothetical protein
MRFYKQSEGYSSKNEIKHEDSTLKDLILRIEEMQHEISKLKGVERKVNEIYDLNTIASELTDEMRQQEAEKLREQGFQIDYLDKQYPPKKRTRRELLNNPITLATLLEIQKVATSHADAARRLGISTLTFVNYCKKHNIHKKLSGPHKNRKKSWTTDPNKGRFPIQDILDGKWPNYPIHRLKDKLIRAGLKKPECEGCGFKTRRETDALLPLLLSFDDGNRKNFRLENLRILCYNCTFMSGRAFFQRGNMHFTWNPDVLQGSKFPLDARF